MSVCFFLVGHPFESSFKKLPSSKLVWSGTVCNATVSVYRMLAPALVFEKLRSFKTSASNKLLGKSKKCEHQSFTVTDVILDYVMNVDYLTTCMLHVIQV